MAEAALALQKPQLHGVAVQRVLIKNMQADHVIQTAEFQIQQQLLALQRVLRVYGSRYRLHNVCIPLVGDGAGTTQLYIPLIGKLRGKPQIERRPLRKQ